MSKGDFDKLSVIALRKTKYYEKIRDQFLERLPQYVDKEDASLNLRDAISRLDNDLFIDESERLDRIIDPTTPVERMRLDKEKLLRDLFTTIISGHQRID